MRGDYGDIEIGFRVGGFVVCGTVGRGEVWCLGNLRWVCIFYGYRVSMIASKTVTKFEIGLCCGEL
jgi:hypothetical protein